MNDDWPTFSTERAFSGEIYEARPEHSFENLVKNLVPDATLTGCDFPTVNSAYQIDRQRPLNVVDVETKKSKANKWAKKRKSTKKLAQNIAENGQKIFSLDQALVDVRNFNIKESKGDEKNEAKQALALKLGAKKPKNKNLPYDELKEQRKTQRAEARQLRLQKKYDGLKKVKGGKIKKKLKKRLGK